MSSELYTVEQVAGRLKLHPKTVLRCIRDGRLRATRIGKSYRIARPDLDAFAGAAAGEPATGPGVQVTSIVELADLSAEAADRIATFLGAAAMTGDAATPALHLSTAYHPGGRRLKVVMIGSPGDSAKLLQMLELQLGARR